MQISTVTHEIRNLLQPIEYHVSVLAARQCDDPQIARALTVIPKQLELIQQFLQNISILNNPLDLVRRPVELRGCMRSIVSRLCALPEAGNTQIQISGLPEPLHVMLDEYWFPIAIEHLTRNAIEAAVEAGDKSIPVNVSVINDTLKISILNHGTGIDSEIANELFQPFVTTKNFAGAGFGLAITKKIIDAHGGKVTLSSSMNPVVTRADVTLSLIAAS
jgi:signal transduction histidine kinase